MKLVLHIGQSKTGTTAIQTFLQNNRKALKSAGVIYPDYYKGKYPLDTINHNSFAEELAGFSRYPRISVDEYWEQFCNQAQEANAHTMILSAESFFGAPQIWRLENKEDFFLVHKKKIVRLKSLTEKDQVEIICYLRSPEDWFESVVAHIVRYEGLFKENIYENDNQMLALLWPHMDYAKILGQWKNVLNPNHITVLPYNKDSLFKGDIVSDFLENISVSLKQTAGGFQEEHKSLDRRYIEVKKLLNKQARSKADERVVNWCLDSLNNNLDYITNYRVDDRLRDKILERCAQSNAWLLENFSKEDQESFFVNENRDDNAKSIIYEDIELSLREFYRLYNSFMAKLVRIKVQVIPFIRKNFLSFHVLAKRLK